MDASQIKVHVRQHVVRGPATVELEEGSFAIVIKQRDRAIPSVGDQVDAQAPANVGVESGLK
jgi:hypothetical protein